MTSHRSDAFTHRQIRFQRFFDFFTKIYEHLISTFSGDFNGIIFEVNIFDVQSNALGNTDTCAQKKSDQCQISFLCLFIIGFFLSSQIFATGFHVFQERCHLIRIQTDDGFFMDLWHINQQCGIGFYHFPAEIIGIEASQRRYFAL